MSADLLLSLSNGTSLFLPNQLQVLTTYVALEQERWFEKEWGFIPRLIKPGMTVLDIGANYGLYTTALAKAVGETGRVYAYEPGSETRRRLEATVAHNGMSQVTVLPAALSDGEGTARLVFGSSSEMNHLASDGEGEVAGETVPLASLDAERARHGWTEIDFIKMDAEGAELKIIAGGQSVFAAGSPVVMFEIKAGATYEPKIAEALAALGFRLFRLLPNERHLVPFVEAELDDFELNLFAAKPDRVARLAAEGLIVVQDEDPGAGDWTSWLEKHAFADLLAGFGDAVSADHAEGLAAFAASERTGISGAQRLGALRKASAAFGRALVHERSIARLCAAARCARELGMRAEANRLTLEAGQLLDSGKLPAEPFPPVLERYQALRGPLDVWLRMSMVEALETGTKFSSYYARAHPLLRSFPTVFLMPEIERRRALSGVLRGEAVQLRIDLGKPQEGHLNADAWRRLIG